MLEGKTPCEYDTVSEYNPRQTALNNLNGHSLIVYLRMCVYTCTSSLKLAQNKEIGFAISTLLGLQPLPILPVYAQRTPTLVLLQIIVYVT